MLAVRRVFTHLGIRREQALAAADSLKGDEDGNVRDAVHLFLDSRPTSVALQPPLAAKYPAWLGELISTPPRQLRQEERQSIMTNGGDQ